MSQINQRLSRRLEMLLKITKLSFVSLECLELRINALLECIAPKVEQKILAQDDLQQVMDFDRRLQEFLIEEYTSFHHLQTMASTATTDSKADMICNILELNNQSSNAKIKYLIFELNRLEKDVRSRFPVEKNT